MLAILIKPIVGVTLVSSGDNYGCSFGNDQLNLGSAVATNQMGIPALSYHDQSGQGGGSDQPYNHGGIATPGTLQTMVNQAQSTAGLGCGAFTDNYQQIRLLQQQEAQQNQYMQQQHIQQLHLQHPHPQAPQNQARQPSFHPELALPAPSRIIINPQIVQMAGQSQPAPAPFIRTKSKTGSMSSDRSSVASLSRTTADCLTQEKSSKHHHHHHHHHQHHQHPNPPPGLKIDTSHVRKDMTSSVSPLVAGGPMIMMDETLLGGRHAQRLKEAIQVAQEASGQQLIQVNSPIAVLPAQIQLPGPGGVGASSTAQAQPRKPSLTGSLNKHPHPHHHHVPSKQQSQEKLHEGGRVDNNEAGPSVQPYIINIPAAIVTPFGSEFVAEAPLPLHLVPSRHQQEKEQS